MYQNDRRMFDRFAVDFSAEIKSPQEEESRFAQCCDVSAGGVGLISEERLIPHTKLEIWLGIPDGHPPFRGLGRVVWCTQIQENKWRAGMEFEQVDFMGIRRIFDLLRPPGRAEGKR